jgi:hypothetical protein
MSIACCNSILVATLVPETSRNERSLFATSTKERPSYAHVFDTGNSERYWCAFIQLNAYLLKHTKEGR